MTKRDIIQHIKKEVHSELNNSKYNATNVRNNTNCYAYAIGSTFPYRKIYRIGAISSVKPIEEPYKSEEEIKALLLEDFKVLDLKMQEIKYSSNKECFYKVQNWKLKSNQYIILLFVKWYANEQIADFHFWRFDREGFSNKRWGAIPVKIDINYYKECWNQKLICAYVISK